jgi:hypothetical protein
MMKTYLIEVIAQGQTKLYKCTNDSLTDARDRLIALYKSKNITITTLNT